MELTSTDQLLRCARMFPRSGWCRGGRCARLRVTIARCSECSSGKRPQTCPGPSSGARLPLGTDGGRWEWRFMSGFKCMFMLTLGLVTRKEVLGYGVSPLSLLQFSPSPLIQGSWAWERRGKERFPSPRPPPRSRGGPHAQLGREVGLGVGCRFAGSRPATRWDCGRSSCSTAVDGFAGESVPGWRFEMLASRLSLRRCCFRELGYHVGCAVSGGAHHHHHQAKKLLCVASLLATRAS